MMMDHNNHNDKDQKDQKQKVSKTGMSHIFPTFLMDLLSSLKIFRALLSPFTEL